MKQIKKIMFIFLGCLALAAGTIGMFLPILPTTPFYLLTLFCFAKGSDRLHTWAVGTAIYTNHLEDFVKNRSLTLKRKLCICIFAGVTMTITFIMVAHPVVRILIAAAMLSKLYYFIFKIKTK